MYKNLLISTKKKGHQNVVQVVEYNQHIGKIFDHTEPQLLQILKGDGNDGEPDALEKLEMEKKAKNWLELKNCGWLGSYLKNIQSDLPNETRGQS